MTPKEAKEQSLEVWRYLAEHPEIAYKSDLPQELYDKVYEMRCFCPLCELYHNDSAFCPACPIKDCGEGSPYEDWRSGGEDERQEAAQKIVAKIEAWEV